MFYNHPHQCTNFDNCDKKKFGMTTKCLKHNEGDKSDLPCKTNYDCETGFADYKCGSIINWDKFKVTDKDRAFMMKTYPQMTPY